MSLRAQVDVASYSNMSVTNTMTVETTAMRKDAVEQIVFVHSKELKIVRVKTEVMFDLQTATLNTVTLASGDVLAPHSA